MLSPQNCELCVHSEVDAHFVRLNFKITQNLILARSIARSQVPNLPRPIEKRKIVSFADRNSGQPRRSPRTLEVETARYAVDIQDFASKEKSGTAAAFHCFEIDFF